MGKLNTIEFQKIMMTQLDQHAVASLTSGWMEKNAKGLIYNGGDEVKIPTMSTQGLANYDRSEGFTKGGVTVAYNSYKMTQDRGRTFLLDAMDVNESNFVATAANVLKTFQETQVIPEIDSYRYSKIYSIAQAGSRTESVKITAENVFVKLRADIRKVQDKIGTSAKLIITMPLAILGLLEENEKLRHFISVSDFTQGEVNFRIKKFDGHAIVTPPADRLKTLYDIKTGAVGQEAGGLTPNASAKDINWIIAAENAPMAVSKTDKIRVFEPDTNQSADAWKVDYRKYHDLWVKKQQEDALFVSVSV
ncbi:MAG: hypothetical protein Q4A29_03810 [Eubacteriales bacterium]|nr:hypothetical protein [Eubacteriales bacterium]